MIGARLVWVRHPARANLYRLRALRLGKARTLAVLITAEQGSDGAVLDWLPIGGDASAAQFLVDRSTNDRAIAVLTMQSRLGAMMLAGADLPVLIEGERTLTFPPLPRHALTMNRRAA